MKHQAIEEN